MIEIPVGRALLLLIEKNQHDLAKRKSLQSLYLNGVLKEQRDELNDLLADPLLREYTVSFQPTLIHDDPTRRYFETHLCFETLKSLLNQIDLTFLKKVNAFFYQNLLKKFGSSSQAMYFIRCVLDVNSPPETKTTNLEKEISDALCRLESRKALAQLNQFSMQNPEAFTVENIAKMQLFLHAAFLGIVYGNTIDDMELNHSDISLYEAKNKGGVCKGNAPETTMNYGIVKGYMPLSSDDAARAQTPFEYCKPSEQTTFQMQGKWPQLNFSLLVHPFANGLSSTTFNQLKAFKQFMLTAKFSQTEIDKIKANLSSYFAGFIATLMFHSGGHTLLEFTWPFLLPNVMKTYENRFGIDTTAFSLNNLFYRNNQDAFERALSSTIEYNRKLLAYAKVHQEILLFNKSKLKPIESTSKKQENPKPLFRP